ncbi:hypothetical protein PSTG_00458 [Puccinia striiformis f. sp. tritici PST-78]|uniref:Uncharacterized protein n=1 Tax=Puccinia striiformis f. sp. tritici PST-78 TaxID=1165861 RepID=A0A0L0W4Y4_9BASI|nr:hypothetical protein PSTG_00458 [Puccinia striiformis f. sp. tritici PST-78]
MAERRDTGRAVLIARILAQDHAKFQAHRCCCTTGFQKMKRDAPDDGKLDEAKTDEAPKKEGTSLSKTDQLVPDLDKFKEDLAKHRKDFDEFTERARKRVDETLAKIEQDHKKADTPAQPPTSSVDTKSTTPTEAPVDKKGGKTSAPQQEVGESPGWV